MKYLFMVGMALVIFGICFLITFSKEKAKKYAQEAEFWQHVGSKMHFVMVSGDSMKTLVTVFAVK